MPTPNPYFYPMLRPLLALLLLAGTATAQPSQPAPLYMPRGIQRAMRGRVELGFCAD